MGIKSTKWCHDKWHATFEIQFPAEKPISHCTYLHNGSHFMLTIKFSTEQNTIWSITMKIGMLFHSTLVDLSFVIIAMFLFFVLCGQLRFFLLLWPQIARRFKRDNNIFVQQLSSCSQHGNSRIKRAKRNVDLRSWCALHCIVNNATVFFYFDLLFSPPMHYDTVVVAIYIDLAPLAAVLYLARLFSYFIHIYTVCGVCPSTFFTAAMRWYLFRWLSEWVCNFETLGRLLPANYGIVSRHTDESFEQNILIYQCSAIHICLVCWYVLNSVAEMAAYQNTHKNSAFHNGLGIILCSAQTKMLYSCHFLYLYNTLSFSFFVINTRTFASFSCSNNINTHRIPFVMS